jgi:hypothetical protein
MGGATMTRADFLKVAGPHFMYMLTESTKKAWEGILPEDGIKAYYRSDRKQNKDRSFTEAYVILIEKYLLEVSVNAEYISCKSHKFDPINIYKSYKTNDSMEIEEVRIQLAENKPEKVLKKPYDSGDIADFKKFIQNLS